MNQVCIQVVKDDWAYLISGTGRDDPGKSAYLISGTAGTITEILTCLKPGITEIAECLNPGTSGRDSEQPLLPLCKG